MASRPKVTQQKRARERARQERQQEKLRRRDEAKERRANLPASAGGEDPDIAGIVPGPQPKPWDDDDLLDDSEDEEESAGVNGGRQYTAGCKFTEPALRAEEKLPRPGGDQGSTPGACCLLPAAVIEGRQRRKEQRAYRAQAERSRKFP